jgi:hypothetical protein
MLHGVDVQQVACSPQFIEGGDRVEPGPLPGFALHPDVGSPGLRQPVKEGVEHHVIGRPKRGAPFRALANIASMTTRSGLLGPPPRRVPPRRLASWCSRTLSAVDETSNGRGPCARSPARSQPIRPRRLDQPSRRARRSARCGRAWSARSRCQGSGSGCPRRPNPPRRCCSGVPPGGCGSQSTFDKANYHAFCGGSIQTQIAS